MIPTPYKAVTPKKGKGPGSKRLQKGIIVDKDPQKKPPKDRN